MVAERPILSAYSLVRKLAASLVSRPNRVRKLKKSARRPPAKIHQLQYKRALAQRARTPTSKEVIII